MFESALHRRHFLATGTAAVAVLASGFGASGAMLGSRIFPRPFAGSRTISSFASEILVYNEICRAIRRSREQPDQDIVPFPLKRALEIELSRTDVTPDSAAQERRRAAFFAGLAVKYVAPFALRRAGYFDMADEVANGIIRASAAQIDIGREYVYRTTPPLASAAWTTCEFTSTTAFYAGHKEVDVVTQTGEFCMNACRSCFDPKQGTAVERARIWHLAVAAINAATEFGTEDQLRYLFV